MKSYSANDFVEALNAGEELTLPTPPVVLTGLVNPTESGLEEILFAPGAQCSDWVEVPASIIDKVDHLRNQFCDRQHEHPLVRLYLKDPAELTAEGRAIASMLRPGAATGSTTSPAAMVTPPADAPPTSQPMPPTPPPGSWPAPPISDKPRGKITRGCS